MSFPELHVREKGVERDRLRVELDAKSHRLRDSVREKKTSFRLLKGIGENSACRALVLSVLRRGHKGPSGRREKGVLNIRGRAESPWPDGGRRGIDLICRKKFRRREMGHKGRRKTFASVVKTKTEGEARDKTINKRKS